MAFELGSSFELMSRETVNVLVQDNPSLLPMQSVNDQRDTKWNNQHVASVLYDGVVNGSSVQTIARDLDRGVASIGNSNRAASTRTIRTAMTSAQNQGRMDAYSKAKAMGVKGKLMWISTIDGRTRDTHAVLDGETIELGGKFSNGLEYPGDPTGDPSEVYNCRCTTTFEVEGVDTSDALRNMTYADGSSRIGDLSYEEWKKQHVYRIFSSNVSNSADAVLESFSERLREAVAETASKEGVTVGQMADTLDRYIHGQYGSVADIMQEKYGGSSIWEKRDTFSSYSAIEVATAEELKEADLMYNLVADQANTPRTLIRTEVNSGGVVYSQRGIGTEKSYRYGMAPEVGQELSFGVKSSSMDSSFAEKIAKNEIAGMGSLSYTVADDAGEVLAYRIKDATRYLDISSLSEFETQQEALIAGRYRVVGVEKTSVATATEDYFAEVKLTMREYAEQKGYELEFFTSKKGAEMVRAGNKTYPISALDTPTIRTGEFARKRVNITYVDLVEI